MENLNIDKEFDTLQEINVDVSNIRKTVISKIKDEVGKLKFDPDEDKATVTTVKLDMVKTLSDVLKDHETSQTNKIKLLIQRENIKNEQKSNQNVAEILKSISHGFLTNANIDRPQIDDIDKKINESFSQSGLAISEDELKETD